MNKWLVFSGVQCAWCVRAKELLAAKDIPYEEVLIDSREKFQFMQQYAPGMRTVPAIVHDGKLVGGYEDLVTYLQSTGD